MPSPGAGYHHLDYASPTRAHPKIMTVIGIVGLIVAAISILACAGITFDAIREFHTKNTHVIYESNSTHYKVVEVGPNLSTRIAWVVVIAECGVSLGEIGRASCRERV